MNSRILVILLSLTFVANFPAAAQEPKPKNKPKPAQDLSREEIAKLGGFDPAPEEQEIIEMPSTVQLELLVAAVPKADTLSLADAFKNPATAAAAFQNLTTLLKNKQAKLVGVPSVETRSGNRCVIEAIQEIRYATEFARGVKGGAPGAPGGAATPTPEAAVEPPPQPKAPAEIGAVPSAFETRNAGITLEAEPVIGPDGKTIDLQFAAQHVQLLSWDTTTVEEKGQVAVRVSQPRFQTNKVTSNITLQSGARVLAGVFESSRHPEMMEFFLLRATTRNAPKAKAK